MLVILKLKIPSHIAQYKCKIPKVHPWKQTNRLDMAFSTICCSPGNVNVSEALESKAKTRHWFPANAC